MDTPTKRVRTFRVTDSEWVALKNKLSGLRTSSPTPGNAVAGDIIEVPQHKPVIGADYSASGPIKFEARAPLYKPSGNL